VPAPVEALIADKAQVSFVRQSGGIERVTRSLRGHAHGCELAQLVVDEGHHVRGRLSIARGGSLQQARDFEHATVVPSGLGSDCGEAL
jgi:hypothetical protein